VFVADAPVVKLFGGCHAALNKDLPHFRCRVEAGNLTRSVSWRGEPTY
jgi:hypothetical protein